MSKPDVSWWMALTAERVMMLIGWFVGGLCLDVSGRTTWISCGILGALITVGFFVHDLRKAKRETSERS